LLLDQAIASACFLMLLPIMAVTATVVLMTLGMPVLFVQERSGRFQRTFRLIKFRTMRDERNSDGELLPDKMRTSRVGSFLRKCRLDEIPGLINVIKGEMALVGPRPLLPQTIKSMGPAGLVRSSVRPGITGWAQVNGNTLLTNEQKVAKDLWYIENKTWKLDIRIIIRTISVVFGEERIQN
jgi:lipopolysaccharide/colanic/teichoic acid biosynthesis glycosyltransferase